MGVIVAQNMNRSNGDMTRRAIDFLTMSDGDSVLEIGPGNGALADYVVGKAADIHYTGIDISETMVEEANRMNRAHVDAGRMTFLHTEGDTIPLADKSVDRVFTVNTLYFWDNPSVQLKEIQRVLKPFGFFCLAIASKTFMRTLPFTPFGFRLYTKEEAHQLLENNGFTITKTHVDSYATSSSSGQTLQREEIYMVAQKPTENIF